MIGKRILVLCPHPDDEVAGASAAIGRARAGGADVRVAFLTNGVPAIENFWPWQRAGHAERVARRWTESAAAARLLGCGIAFRQDIATRTLKSALGETRAAIEAFIRRAGVDMLWTPAFEGAHQDHDAVNCLASLFTSRIPVWEFAEYNNGSGERWGRTLSQEFFAPNGTETVLELSEPEMAVKRAAMALYASERGNLKHIKAAREAFRPLPSYDYARSPHDGVLFYQRFQWVWPRHPRVDYTRPEEVATALAAFRAKSV